MEDSKMFDMPTWAIILAIVLVALILFGDQIKALLPDFGSSTAPA